MRLIYLFLLLLISHLSTAQFFHYEILEGKEYFESGKVYCEIEYDKNWDKTVIKIKTRLARNTSIPKEIQGSGIYIAYHFKITQGTALLYSDNASRYTSAKSGVYKAEFSSRYTPFKDPYVIEASGKFSTSSNQSGYGNPVFKIKLKVTPNYFDSYEATDAVDTQLKEQYKMVIDNKSNYYPRVKGSVKIYVEKNGKRIEKPTGYIETDFTLKTRYIYQNKTLKQYAEEGTSFDTPFFNHDKDNYYLKLGKKGLSILSNKQFSAGSAEIEIIAELYKSGKLVFKESKKVTINVPKFSSYSFRLTGAELLPDGQKMFQHNSKWNNQGRDPYPDLFCKVTIDGLEVGRTSEETDSFSSNNTCNVTFYYIQGKPVDIVFSLIDKDAFLNPNDLLLKQEQGLLEFLKTKPVKVTDNYLGSFTIAH